MATSFPTYPATTFEQSVELAIFSSNQLHNIINADSLSTVETEEGDIPSVRKALIDNLYFKTPAITWTEGGSVTVFNQLYTFSGGTTGTALWYAPTASANNIIVMGDSPEEDVNWRLYGWDTYSKTEINSENGASYIGTSGGKTVQDVLNQSVTMLGEYENGPLTLTSENQEIRYAGFKYYLADGVSLPYTTTGNTATTWATDEANFVAVGDAALRQGLAAKSGYSLIGQVASFADLCLLVPTYAGQRVKLASVTDAKPYGVSGWGGGEFVAVAGAPDTEYPGLHAVVNSEWYWCRVIPKGYQLDVTDFLCDPTGETTSDAELKVALAYSAATGSLITQSGITYITQWVDSPTGVQIDFKGFVVMEDDSGIHPTYSAIWCQGLARASGQSNIQTQIYNLRLSTSRTDTIQGSARENPFDGKAMYNNEYISLNYFYSSGTHLGGWVTSPNGSVFGGRIDVYLRRRVDNSSKYINARGYDNQGSDTKLEYLGVTKYAVGMSSGQYSSYGIVHAWGLAALSSSDPNQAGYAYGQMLCGAIMGNSSYIGQFYCDTPDTLDYDTAASYNDSTAVYIGYGIVFRGYESHIGNMVYLLQKSSQKNNKVRVAHYRSGSTGNVIDYIDCHDGAIFDTGNDTVNGGYSAITYGDKVGFFNNWIGSVSDKNSAKYLQYRILPVSSELTMNGVTSASGYVTYKRNSNTLACNITCSVSAVNSDATGSFSVKLNSLPAGLMSRDNAFMAAVYEWGAISTPTDSGAYMTVQAQDASANLVNTWVKIPRPLGELELVTVTPGTSSFTLGHPDIINGTPWTVGVGQLRTGNLNLLLQIDLT